MAADRRVTPPALVRLALSVATVLAVLASAFAFAPKQAAAVSNGVVISQVYGGGGNTGATLRNDFIELFNRGAAPVSLNGWKVRYNNATATFTADTALTNVQLQPGQYYLVQEAAGTTGGSLNLPAPDATGNIAMNATVGGVTLLDAGDAVVDRVGYGATATLFEGAPTPAPSNTASILRAGFGCTDTDNNAADFFTSASIGGITPLNTASPLHACGNVPPPTNTATLASTPTTPPVVGATRIHDIQGASHTSPLNSTTVSNVPGIVTVVRPNGFYYQDPAPDASDATSEAIFVFTSSAPAVTVGDAVLVSGTVTEFRPGGAASTNLTTSEIASPTVSVQSSGNALPAPVVIGVGGRTPPTTVIEDDAAGSVETSGMFDPTSDGIDFYESLEAMRVQVNDAVVVGPTNSFGEITVLPDNGAGAGPRTTRGGIVLGDNYSDANPERLQIDDTITANPPQVNVGDSFPGAIVGVLDYSFGNFELLNTQALPAPVSAGLAREISTAAGPNQLSLATFNVENLDPADGAAKFNALASVIVGNLRSPDIISVEEVQDNNGPTNDAVVDANVTYQTLIDAIVAAGGPTYIYRQINPVDDQDGGEPGGNIRVGFLFRTDRGLAFVDRPGATPTTANSVVNAGGAPQLQYSPGRIDPTNAAFNSSRKPLAGEFTIAGQTIFVIANHFNSKGGDQPLFGRFQPPTRSSEVQRQQQAQIVAGFVSNILAIDPAAKIAVVGDLNDFEFSPVVATLKAAGLADLIETLPKAERYSYVFEGNSQTLDHILVSTGLLNRTALFDSVHVNAEFAAQVSDHDPQLAIFNLADETTATPTSTPSATATDTPTITPSATATDTPTITPSATTTDTPTITPSATTTDTPTITPSVTTTDTPTITPSATTTDTPTATPTSTPSATTTDTPTITPSATTTDTPTTTPSAMATSTATDTPTSTPSATATSTATNTPTSTPSATATSTATNTPTSTPSATATAVRNPVADVAIVKTGTFDSARRLVTFVLTLSNSGPNAARNVELIDELDGDLDFVSLTTTGSACVYNSAPHRVTCTYNTLDSGSTATITIVTAVENNPRSIRNTARVEADTRDPKTSNNRSSVTIRVR